MEEEKKERKKRMVRPLIAAQIQDGKFIPLAAFPADITDMDEAIKWAVAQSATGARSIIFLRVAGKFLATAQTVLKFEVE
jgi:hypothetical protein